MIKKIVFCADRPDNGPSGGGAGVMFLLRKYLDVKKCKYPVEYVYRNKGRFKFIVDLIRRSIFDDSAYYICHEPDSAAILNILGKNYALVYHQQGPIIQEYLSRVAKPSKYKVMKKKFIEKKAFLGADRVFFPSEGAGREFFDSPYCTVKDSQVTIGKPLYNTINIDENIVPIDDVEQDKDCLTFISVGTMTKLKGQDQTLKSIYNLIKKTEKKIRWITVGDGLLKDDIVKMCLSLMQSHPHFTHIHFDKLPHGSVLYLDLISDIYIMLHRSSIFDLATLEAMNNNCAIILSNIGGNLDFNKEDNCLLISDDNSLEIDIIEKFDIEKLKILNKNVFEKYFSPECFSNRYIEMINSIV